MNKGMLFGLGVVGIASYFYIKNKQVAAQPQSPNEIGSASSQGLFPLKFGSKGKEVETMQKALMVISNGAGTLLKRSGGADGDFGKGTEAALAFAGYPKMISQAAYVSLTNRAADLIQNKYVVVDSFNGETIFKEVGEAKVPFVGYGRYVVSRLPNRTYVGVTTGNEKNGMLEVTTTISGKSFAYWIDKTEVKLLTKSEFEAKKGSSDIIQKSDPILKLIIKNLS